MERNNPRPGVSPADPEGPHWATQRGDAHRQSALQDNAIGPVWDANEVWLIVAGGAMFAVFPQWYATLFSGFYLALFGLLVALIVRGVGIGFRSKDERPGWRQLWDWLFFFSSLVPAVVWGVALTDLVQGLPIDGHMNYVGSFLDLFTPFSLVGGRLLRAPLRPPRRSLPGPQDRGAPGLPRPGRGPAPGPPHGAGGGGVRADGLPGGTGAPPAGARPWLHPHPGGVEPLGGVGAGPAGTPRLGLRCQRAYHRALDLDHLRAAVSAGDGLEPQPR
ncbi:membrane protein of unknown function [Candidatus Hydrogenisulfobacillus filiaventi]|uniref:Cytochrome d ubiquinol oxidase subunit II n=1 Tax=Candidatus Hydrogenisulfobacillus filiaventi TaxID=2707344 RepID=A0A6F8ZF89_9FIRM|nr:membrane protein of unknown function [Candidatus Hydrogenisulfobacillus filiaventi]